MVFKLTPLSFGIVCGTMRGLLGGFCHWRVFNSLFSFLAFFLVFLQPKAWSFSQHFSSFPSPRALLSHWMSRHRSDKWFVCIHSSKIFLHSFEWIGGLEIYIVLCFFFCLPKSLYLILPLLGNPLSEGFFLSHNRLLYGWIPSKVNKSHGLSTTFSSLSREFVHSTYPDGFAKSSRATWGKSLEVEESHFKGEILHDTSSILFIDAPHFRFTNSGIYQWKYFFLRVFHVYFIVQMRWKLFFVLLIIRFPREKNTREERGEGDSVDCSLFFTSKRFNFCCIFHLGVCRVVSDDSRSGKLNFF